MRPTAGRSAGPRPGGVQGPGTAVPVAGGGSGAGAVLGVGERGGVPLAHGRGGDLAQLDPAEVDRAAGHRVRQVGAQPQPRQPGVQRRGVRCQVDPHGQGVCGVGRQLHRPQTWRVECAPQQVGARGGQPVLGLTLAGEGARGGAAGPVGLEVAGLPAPGSQLAGGAECGAPGARLAGGPRCRCSRSWRWSRSGRCVPWWAYPRVVRARKGTDGASTRSAVKPIGQGANPASDLR